MGVALLASSVILSPLSTQAADIYWNNSSGGSFTNSTNWNGNLVPGIDDKAIFDLSSPGYTVTFDSGIQTKELSIDNDTVIFDLAGNEYLVLSDLLGNFALDIGILENQSGNLTVLNGTLRAITTDRGTRIGGDNGGVGSLTVNNQGAFLTNGLDVVRGSVTILNGSITAESGFGTFGEEGSPVIFLVDGANSVLQFDGGAFGCDYCTSPPSDTLLTVANGGTVNGNFMRIVDDVVLSGTTSTLNVQQVFISGNVAGPGNLSGNGSITGNLQNVSGIVSPGLSIGNLIIDGNYQQETDAVLNLEIGGTTPTLYDQLIVSGNVDLFSGTSFTLDFVDGFSPAIGDEFTDLITFGGNFNGDLDSLNITSPDLPFGSFSAFTDADSFGIRVDQTVPEPLTLLGASAAVAFGAAFKRRRRA